MRPSIDTINEEADDGDEWEDEEQDLEKQSEDEWTLDMPCCVHLALALARMHCPHPQLTASLALAVRQDPFSLQPWALAALIWSTTVQGACPPNWLKQLGPAVKEYVEDGRMHPTTISWCSGATLSRKPGTQTYLRRACTKCVRPSRAAATELPGGNTAASRREALQREVSVAKLRQLLLRPGSWAPGHVLACYARLGATLPLDLAATLRNLNARNRWCASRPLVPPWMSRVRGVPMMPPRGIGAVKLLNTKAYLAGSLEKRPPSH